MAIHYYEDYDESWYQNDYKEVKISDDGLKLIGVPVTYEGAFTVPAGIKEICNIAFKDCQFLTSIVLADTVEEIGTFAFAECGGVNELVLPEALKILNGAAFAKSNIRSIVIPSGVNKIYEHFIYVDDHSSDVYWYGNSSAGNMSLHTGLFDTCLHLEYAEINANIETIHDQMFNNCRVLEKIVLPDSIRSIKGSPFGGCEHLKEIVFRGSRDQWNEIEGVDKFGDNILVSCMR